MPYRRRIIRLRSLPGGLARRVLLLSLSGLVAGTISAVEPPRTISAPIKYSLWPDVVIPGSPADPEVAALELGTKFTSRQSGRVLAVRFYKSAENTGPHTGSLWDGQGRRLGAVTFASESRQGWQQASFASPVTITAGTPYVVSYTTQGRYAGDRNYFLNGVQRTYGPLTATAGVYRYGSGFPVDQWQASNYYADVVFAPTSPNATPPVMRTPTSTGSVSFTRTTTTTQPPSTTSSTSTSPSRTTTTTAPPADLRLGCVTQPSSCGYPDASNTGVATQTATRQASGCVSARTDNQVIENLTITDCGIDIFARNVTIRNVKVVRTAVDTWAIRFVAGSSGQVLHSEISGKDKGVGSVQYAILSQTDSPVRIDRVNMHHCADCVQGESVTLTNSYIHDLANPPGAHVDGFQCNSTCGVTIRGNTILNEWSQTAAVALFGDFGTPRNSLIEKNLLAGGGYSVYGGTPQSTGIRIADNRFAKIYYQRSGLYGTIAHFTEGLTNIATGNYWDDTGTKL